MGIILRRLGGVVACLLVLAVRADAEPYFAVREGLPCGSCHVNRTGGGKRTDLVNTHARDLLHYARFLGAFSNPPEFFTSEINQYLGLGADMRVSETAIFQDQPDNGRVDNNKAFRGRLDTNTIAVTEAVGYVEARLIPEHLTVYLDQRFQPQTDTREAWGMLYGLPGHGFIKAGRMFLPYGLQLQDDTAFIRGGYNGSATTGFSFNQQQAAFEVGFEPGPFTLVGAVSEGPAGDRDVQVTTTISALITDLPVVRHVLIGNSFSRVGPPGTQTVVFGFFAGTNLERLTVLGEGDFRSDKTAATAGTRQGRFICYGEGDYLFFDWLNFKVAADYADNDGNLADRSNDSENRISVGLEPFLNRFVQPRLFYRIGNGIESNPSHNQNVLLAEVHLFF